MKKTQTYLSLALGALLGLGLAATTGPAWAGEGQTEDTVRQLFGAPVQVVGPITNGYVLKWSSSTGQWSAQPDGGGSSAVNVSGSGLSGDGSVGDPLTLATVLQNLAGSGYLAVGTSATPSTGDGDLVASDGTRTLTWDASAGTLNVAAAMTLSGSGTIVGGSSAALGIYGGSTQDLVLGRNGSTAMLTFGNSVITAASGTILNMAANGTVAFGLTGNDPQITKETTDTLFISDGTNPITVHLANVNAAGGYVDVGSGSVRFGQSGAASSPRLMWAGATGALVNRLKIMHADLANMGDIYAGVLFTTNDVSGNAAGWQYVSPQGSWNGCMRPIDNGLNQTQVSIAANGAANKLALNGYNTNEGLWIGSDLIGFGVNDSEVGRFTSSGLQGGSATGNALVKAGASSVSAPALSFVGDTDTGLHRAAADAPGLVGGGKLRTVVGDEVTLVDNTATTIATISLSAGQMVAGTITVHAYVTDGTDVQAISQAFEFSAVDKAGTLTSVVAALAHGSGIESKSVSAGTLGSLNLSISDGTNAIGLQVTLDTSLTPTAFIGSCEISYLHSSTSHTVSFP